MSDWRIYDIMSREIAFGKSGDELHDVCEAFSWILGELEALACGPCECPCAEDAKTEALRMIAKHNPDFKSIYEDAVKFREGATRCSCDQCAAFRTRATK